VLLSALFSSDLSVSTRHLPGLSLLLLLPITMDLVDTVPRARTVLLALCVSGCLLSLLGLWQYFVDRGYDINERIQATLSHWMTFSGLVALTGCLLLGFAFEERGRWRKVGFAAILPLGVLLLTYTRSVWVGTLAAVILYLCLRRPGGLLILAPTLAVIFLLLPGEIRHRVVSIGDLSDPTTRDRIAMTRSGLRMVYDHPFFGVGPDMVKRLYPVYRDPQAVRALVPHLHNNTLQLAAQSGLPAAAAYVALVAVVLAVAIRKLRRETRPERAALLAGALLAVTALTIAGFFEYNFGDTEVEMATLLVMAIPFCRALEADPA
jgi:O-antigen ligase